MINNKFVYVKLTNIFSLILILESNFGQSYGFKWGLPRWFCGKEGALSGASGDSGSIPWLGRYPGGGNSNLVQCSFFFFLNIYLFICRVLITGPPGRSLLQYSCLGNPMDRGAWWAAESMCLQTNVFGFFWSENVDRVTQDASNFCHSCQDGKMNPVPKFNSSKSGILYFSALFKWLLFCIYFSLSYFTLY